MSHQAASQFSTPFGSFQLNRYPLRKRETLQAWDAADEYLLNYLAEEKLPAGSRILILNDQFGAVTVSLAAFRITLQTDSYIAAWSVAENLKLNSSADGSVDIRPSTAELSGSYDFVLIRVPKIGAMLEHQLITIRPHLKENSRVIGYGRVKQIHTSTLDLFSSNLGPTRTTLAKKKARLILTAPDRNLPSGKTPFPTSYVVDKYAFKAYNYANLFSRERLDIGSRLLLEHIPRSTGFKDIVDLGCGCGILGVIAGSINPQAKLFFTDESYMAVASAEQTAKAAGIENALEFIVNDALSGIAQGSVDLVLCNPPFHQQNVMGDFIAWRMFKQAVTRLRRGGELLVVGNRHLKYHVKLKRLFGNAEVIASNRKFVVIKTIRS